MDEVVHGLGVGKVVHGLGDQVRWLMVWGADGLVVHGLEKQVRWYMG